MAADDKQLTYCTLTTCNDLLYMFILSTVEGLYAAPYPLYPIPYKNMQNKPNFRNAN